MDVFIKATAAVLIAAILSLVLSNYSKHFAVLLAIGASCMILATAIQHLQPVISLLNDLRDLGNLDPDILKILLKAVGIGILGETVSMICSDSGNATLGKSVQLLSSVMILFLSIPLLQRLIELIEKILSNN